MRYLKTILKAISIILIAVCFYELYIDYTVHYRFGSAPFYFYIISRTIEFIIPAIVALIVSKKIK